MTSPAGYHRSWGASPLTSRNLQPGAGPGSAPVLCAHGARFRPRSAQDEALFGSMAGLMPLQIMAYVAQNVLVLTRFGERDVVDDLVVNRAVRPHHAPD